MISLIYLKKLSIETKRCQFLFCCEIETLFQKTKIFLVRMLSKSEGFNFMSIKLFYILTSTAYDSLKNPNIFRSIYHLTMLAVPHLIKTQGNIVNVSSVNGVRSVSFTIYWWFHNHYDDTEAKRRFHAQGDALIP